MAKIYYRKYKAMIDSGEVTLEQAITLVESEVPERWKEEVKWLLNN